MVLAQELEFARHHIHDDDDDRKLQHSGAVSHHKDQSISPSTLQKLNILLDDVASLQNQVYSLARTVAIRKVPAMHAHFQHVRTAIRTHHLKVNLLTPLADNPVTHVNTQM